MITTSDSTRVWRVVVAGVAAVALVVGTVAVVRSRSSTPPDQQVAVPAYIPPDVGSSDWDRLISSDPSKVGLVVANVASGPGTEVNPMWREVMTRTHNSGKRVLGYVDTGYLGRSNVRTRSGSTSPEDWRRQIDEDVAGWYALYPGVVDGIFFDRASGTCGTSDSDAQTYTALRTQLRQRHGAAMTVLNAGVAVPQCYEDAADVLVTYESGVEGYLADPDQVGNDNYRSPDWTPRDPRQFWHIVHGVPADQVQLVLSTARDRGAGYVYVTDQPMPNPYDDLPDESYWSAEQSAVNGVPPASLPKVPATSP